MTSVVIPLVIAFTTTIMMIGIGQQQMAYAWPAGTTEEQKNKIMTATDSLQLTQEEYMIAEERMYEIFDTFQEKEEFDAFDECGFSAAEDGFKVLQCWEKKGHAVR